MKTLGAFEAKTKLSELLDLVEKGEEVTITRHGKPVADLIPARRRRPDRETIERIVRTFREIRQEDTETGGIRELIEEGRRH